MTLPGVMEILLLVQPIVHQHTHMLLTLDHPFDVTVRAYNNGVDQALAVKLVKPEKIILQSIQQHLL